MKSLTALAKLLTFTVILSSTVACSAITPYQSDSVRQPSVVAPHGGGSLLVDALANLYTNARFGLTERQKEKQNAAVYTALESEYGKLIQWYEKDAKGAVKAVHGYPMGAGFCRVIFSYIEVNGQGREFQETACKSVEYEGWRFQRKRR